MPQSHKDLWRKRLSAPNEKLAPIMSAGGSPNSYCYRMLSEWNRYRLRLAYDQSTIVNAIESLWGNTEKKGHRNLIVSTRWNLFLDKLTSPDSLSTEAAGRVQLLLLAHSGYSGPSAGEILSAAEQGTHTMMFLENPVGETPPNGRTDNHLWVDAGNAAAMELMVEQMHRRGNTWRAGQFRRAAMLTLSPQNIGRFRRPDGAYFTTKNRFDPSLYVSYQGAYGLAYDAMFMAHVAEAYQ